MNVKLLTEHNLEFLSFKEGFIGLSESTLVKMPHCWKSHVAAPFIVARIVCGSFVFGPCFIMQYLLSFIVMQSPRRERESWLLNFSCHMSVSVLCLFITVLLVVL